MTTKLVSLWTHPITKLLASTLVGLAWWIALRLFYAYPLIIPFQLQLITEQTSEYIVPEKVSIPLIGTWDDIYNFVNNNPTIKISPALLTRGLQEFFILSEHLNLPNNLRLAKTVSIPIFFNPSH